MRETKRQRDKDNEIDSEEAANPHLDGKDLRLAAKGNLELVVHSSVLSVRDLEPTPADDIRLALMNNIPKSVDVLLEERAPDFVALRVEHFDGKELALAASVAPRALVALLRDANFDVPLLLIPVVVEILRHFNFNSELGVCCVCAFGAGGGGEWGA